jgi:Uncharacterized protein conserved in bacteria
LRVFSPSAEVQRHQMGVTKKIENFSDQKSKKEWLLQFAPPRVIPNRKFVGIMNIERVGNYAIQF